MKIKIDNEKYYFITDDSRLINSKGAFLITNHNQKFKNQAEKKGCEFFLTTQELFQKWELDKIKIIGITGTNGKTTTTNIIAYILKNLGLKIVVSGTEGVFLHTKNKIKKIAPRTYTTPEILTTLNNLKIAKENSAKYYIMEVSSHGIFQKRIEGINFALKIFTNLSQDHLDFHKNMKEYAKIKSSFFGDKVWKIINLDDLLIEYTPENFLTYSLKNEDADLYATNFHFQNGIKTELSWKGKKYKLESKMIGKFNLYNLLASVLSVLKITNFKIETILEKVKGFSGIEGRMEIIYKKEKDKKFIKVFTDYAHTPDAIEKVLKSIKGDNLKIITIVGSGGDRDKKKRPIMAINACQNSDFVFLTSDNPRSEKPENILNDMEVGIKNKFDNYKIIVDRGDAIKDALKKAENKFKKGESIFVAILGKGNEDYMEIKSVKVPYSDKKEVKKYF